MSAYLQMGHDSANLLLDGELEDFSGLVLSPINEIPQDLRVQVGKFRKTAELEIIFDPQLYYPANERGQLPRYKYFPSDFETADRGSDAFWSGVIEQLCETGSEVGADSICSPIYVPKKYDTRYFDRCIRNFELLANSFGASSSLLTVCIGLNEFSDPNDAFNLASRLTGLGPERCYLVLVSDLKPRREIADRETILGLLSFLSAMESAGCRMLVSHCSSEIVLLKAAGVSDCASGKFFNLRRFMTGRFKDDGDAGGRNVTYWFEEGLMAFLRQPDVLRIDREQISGVLNQGDSANGAGQRMFPELKTKAAEKLLGQSWRQYLSWFGRMENRLSGGDAAKEAKSILVKALNNWHSLQIRGVRMEEPENDGAWVNVWKTALDEFLRLEF